MKKSILALLFCAVAGVAVFANGHIPAVVQQKFAQLYPDAEAPFWEKRHDGIVAIFQDLEGLKKAFFQEDGQWVETRIRMNREQLPSGVNDFINKNYGEAEITFCGKVYTDSGTWYRIESELPNEIVLKNLDANGVLINEQSIKLSTISVEAAPILNITPTKLLPRKQVPMLERE